MPRKMCVLATTKNALHKINSLLPHYNIDVLKFDNSHDQNSKEVFYSVKVIPPSGGGYTKGV